MANPVSWLLGAVVVLGLGLGCLSLLGRPIRGGARAVAWAHGLAGVAGCVWAWIVAGPGAGVWMLALAVAGGLVVAGAELRGRRPPGLATVLHAAFGAAGFVLLLAAFG